jgi:hypothetical protein
VHYGRPRRLGRERDAGAWAGLVAEITEHDNAALGEAHGQGAPPIGKVLRRIASQGLVRLYPDSKALLDGG